MAKSDVVYRRGRGGYSGGGSSSYYDDEGRGSSKNVWEWFERSYTHNNFQRSWLLGLDADTCHKLVAYSTDRFGLVDICVKWHEDWDSRAKRLVDKHDKGGWHPFFEHLKAMWEEWKKEEQERMDNQNKKWEAERLIREAAAQKVALDDIAQMEKAVELTSGVIRSDFADVFRTKEVVDQVEGDWIDDVVGCYMTGRGFGEEVHVHSSVKLQVSVALDCSNSMYYNRISESAAIAFREVGTTLQSLKREFGTDLFISFWTFSSNRGYDDSDRGKRVQQVARPDAERTDRNWYSNVQSYESDGFNGWEFLRPSRQDYQIRDLFEGEDTWIAPLFKEIEAWENKYSDPGCVKLDLIITDAVLEHPTDIREASVVQERRDGSLQTIMLNFMPEEQWVKSTLPRRCTQYAVNADNIAGMLRNVLMEFASIQL